MLYIHYRMSQSTLTYVACHVQGNDMCSCQPLLSGQYNALTIVKIHAKQDLLPNCLSWIEHWFAGIVELCSLLLSYSTGKQFRQKACHLISKNTDNIALMYNQS